MATLNAENRVAPSALSGELEKEMSGRIEEAGARASDLEQQAREWRAVEAACQAALASLKEGRHG